MSESNVDIADLVELQLLDNVIKVKIADIERLKNSSQLKKLKKDLSIAAEEYDSINEEHEKLIHEQKKMEDKVATQTEKVKKNEDKLFSGTITNPKELENYQKEIQMLNENNDEIENDILELMEKIDKEDKQVNSIEEKKDKLQVKVDEKIKSISEDIDKIEGKIEEYKNKKEDILKEIPQDILTKYNKLKDKKAGVAVAVLNNGVCNGCNMKIHAAKAEKMDDEDTIYECPLCGRMLVINSEKIEGRRSNI